MEEPTCVLRTLTLCDGHLVADVPPRTGDVPCYCRGLSAPGASCGNERAQTLRTARARVVARAAEAERIRARRHFLPAEF